MVKKEDSRRKETVSGEHQKNQGRDDEESKGGRLGSAGFDSTDRAEVGVRRWLRFQVPKKIYSGWDEIRYAMERKLRPYLS